MAHAVALARELAATQPRTVLLHGDFHPGNVLAAAREPWLAIDPKPYVGDPAYDTLQHMLNFPGRLAADPAGLARRMAGLLDLDADRVRLWLRPRSRAQLRTIRKAQASSRSGSERPQDRQMRSQASWQASSASRWPTMAAA